MGGVGEVNNVSGTRSPSSACVSLSITTKETVAAKVTSVRSAETPAAILSDARRLWRRSYKTHASLLA